ncbi:hypothetical protein GKC56_07155 [Neisseriaceae bacterium PsAf]|nr:hypothetical protein [Neisseriaceae bacterium PsAf]MCV2503558.1 hypothetical protein [Neisseriaceae bacterium]
MRKVVYSFFVGALMFGTSPNLSAKDSYVFNSDGPTGKPVIDTSYNFGKDVSWTVLKFAFLPVEIVVKFIINAI